VKVRIGVGAGIALSSPATLGGLADAIEAHGFDSIWLPELLTLPTVDPIAALGWLAARNPGLKLGTTLLLPGRNVVRLANQMAGLDALSGGRLLVTGVPGLAVEPERSAIGVAPRQRGAAIDEVLPVLRRLWAGERVSHHGPAGDFDDVVLAPLPAQDPLEVWLGGTAPASLERCGRLGDGWLPGRCTPAEAAAGKAVVEEAADAAGRAISPEHYGVSIAYARQAEAAATGAGRDPRGPRPEVLSVGLPALRELLEAFIAVGFSKFVVRPVDPTPDWDQELGELAAAVGDLQT
jgi:probable F420-dependent oxidoreductase